MWLKWKELLLIRNSAFYYVKFLFYRSLAASSVPRANFCVWKWRRHKTRTEFKIKDQLLPSSNITTTFHSGLSRSVYQQADITPVELLKTLGGTLTVKPSSVPSCAFDFLCRLWRNPEFGASGDKADSRRIHVSVLWPDNVCWSCRYPFDIHGAFYIFIRSCHLWSSVITELFPIDFKTSTFLLFPINSDVNYL